MFEALRADPCRVIEMLLDYRCIYRFLRNWRLRGTAAIVAELSSRREEKICVNSFDFQPSDYRAVVGSVLVIDARIPQFDCDAGGRASFLYMQVLLELGYQVFFMPNDQLSREPYASVLRNAGVKLLVGKQFACGKWEKWLRSKHGHITHVFLHRPNVAQRYLKIISKINNIKILYFAHDMRFQRELRHYEIDGDAFHLMEARYWERIEREILLHVHRAYFFSDDETRLANSWGAGLVARTMPLFPVNPQRTNGLPYEKRAGLLFVGGFAHQPNRDAVLWFAGEVFPLVRRMVPDMEWHIVGRCPPSELVGLMQPGMVIEGGVDDARMKHLYQSVRLVVAPLRFGAGVKGKVVEAMQQCVPTVTTQIGAEGIPDAGNILYISNSAEEMAEQITALYIDRLQWNMARDRLVLGANNHYSRASAMRKLSEDLRLESS